MSIDMYWEPGGGSGLKGCLQGTLDRTWSLVSVRRVRDREELRALLIYSPETSKEWKNSMGSQI